MKNNKKCILIADDENEIRSILKMLLTGDGYHVIEATNGREALELSDEDVDLFILDVNMPEMTGFEAACELRKTTQTPIIFLTAYSRESDKIMGFSTGGDDYIIKPFSNGELLMRIKAILRRSSGSLSQSPESRSSDFLLPFQDLMLDLNSKSIMKNEEMIPLTYTEYKIIELLVTHKKKIYSLDNIYESIWAEEAVGDSAIMVHIKNIRKKLGDDSRNPKYIKTAWGRGYYVD